MNPKIGYFIVLLITIYQCINAYFYVQYDAGLTHIFGGLENFHLQSQPYKSVAQALFFLFVTAIWTFLIIRQKDKKNEN